MTVPEIFDLHKEEDPVRCLHDLVNPTLVEGETGGILKTEQGQEFVVVCGGINEDFKSNECHILSEQGALGFLPEPKEKATTLQLDGGARLWITGGIDQFGDARYSKRKHHLP